MAKPSITSTRNAINSLLDKRLTSELNDLKVEINRSIEERFTKERGELKDYIQWLSSTTKWAGGALILFLGLFGLKSCEDIKTNTQTFLQESLSKRLGIEVNRSGNAGGSKS